MEPIQAEIAALLDAFSKGRMAEAEQRAAEMTRAHPGVGFGWRALGIILAQQGRAREALIPMQRTAAFFPEDAETHNNLGAVLQRLEHFADAEACFRRAVALKPGYAEAYNNLGTALMKQGRLAEAESAFRQAIAYSPGYAEPHNNLGILLRDMCRIDESVASFRAALALNPDNAKLHQNLIFTMDFGDFDAAFLQAERKRWAARFAPAQPRTARFANLPDPERPLRIGYVSADFKFHSSAVVFGAMLTGFDAGNFAVFAYSNTPVADDVTAIFQNAVTVWRPVVGLSDDAVVDLIEADAIDILVDLSGHSLGNRLKVFARRPAPIQITAWGYHTGTGLDAIDVFFSDPVLIPENEKGLYAERQVRYLPNAMSVFWPIPLPDVGPLPASSAGVVTFGSFNRLVKASDQTFAAWARVLGALPHSRFMMKTPELDEPSARDRVLRRFAEAGIGPERLILRGKTSWREHMLAFNEVDIALDPFPQSGGVTTLESLAMGVPMVTLKWPTVSGRASASLLTALNMTDWIAATQDEYAEIAVSKARNLQELAAVRLGLRARMDASVIGRKEAYVATAEREFRALWRAWCAAQQGRETAS